MIPNEDGEELVVEAPAHVIPPTPQEQTKAARGALLWTWIARTVGLAIIAAILAFGVYLATANAGARSERFELIEQLAIAHAQLDEERAKVDALIEQVEATGEDPVVESTDPTDAAQPGPAGPRGDPGTPGRAPTAEEVYDAVVAFCASIGGCKGATGDDGVDGLPGPPGSDGSDGATGATGAQGEPGTPGAPGAPGVSVTGVSCVLREDAVTVFRFTFSDGSVADVPGPCLP